MNLLKDVCYLKENAVIDLLSNCSYNVWCLHEHLINDISEEAISRIMTTIRETAEENRSEVALFIKNWCLSEDTLHSLTTENIILLGHKHETPENFYRRALDHIKSHPEESGDALDKKQNPPVIHTPYEDLYEVKRYLFPIGGVDYLFYDLDLHSAYLATIKKERINNITAKTLVRIHKALHSLELKGLIKYGHLIVDNYMIHRGNVYVLLPDHKNSRITFNQRKFIDRCDAVLQLIKKKEERHNN